MGDSTEVCGLLYKKRGGFGKMMPNAWQFRYFTISKDGMLCYFDTDKPEIGLSDAKARGKLDLKSNYDLVLDQQIEGAPTAYSIQICPSGEEKWKLCAENKEDYVKWCLTLERYLHDKPVRTNVNNPASYASDDEIENKRRNIDISCRSRDSGEYSALNTPVSKGKTNPIGKNKFPEVSLTPENTGIQKTEPKIVAPVVTGHKKRLKLGNKAEFISSDTMEVIMVLIIVNLCFFGFFSANPDMIIRKIFCIVVLNAVVMHTLNLRAGRVVHTVDVLNSNSASLTKVEVPANRKVDKVVVAQNDKTSQNIVDLTAAVQQTNALSVAEPTPTGKPTPGFTFTEVQTEPRLSASHTWCRVDHRQFNVREGPEYNRYKKKAASGPPIYEPFAVDVFCTKLRVDHAATRFQLPDTSHINTHHEFVPPIIVLQIQIPSEPPTSIFSSSEDGPGWAIVMYYRISEDACNQLKDFATASPAVKLFAEWCEKAPVDPAWRGRFKVINSCTNLEELGMPSAIVSYNAKPVLIRRTGTIFRGPNYLEMDIHVHKFANLAKQSIYLISSRCGLMFMQIGFVIEGRDDSELPEALFACVAVNKPQEDQAEFIFEDEE